MVGCIFYMLGVSEEENFVVVENVWKMYFKFKIVGYSYGYFRGEVLCVKVEEINVFWLDYLWVVFGVFNE